MLLTNFNTNTGGISSALSIISLILIFIIIVILAYYTTRFIARYQNNALSGKANIRVLESFRVGGNKVIAVIEVCGNFYVVGIGKEEITMIDRLDDEAVRDIKEKHAAGMEIKPDFKDIFARIKNKSVQKDNDTDDKDDTK